MSSHVGANGAMSNNNGVNGAQPARDSRGRFCRRAVETPEPAVEIHGRVSFGRPYVTFTEEERAAYKARREEQRKRAHEGFVMRQSVERAANVSLPYDLADLVGPDRVCVITISREYEWNPALFRKDNWPKLKIVSKPVDVNGLADPKSDDRYATVLISGGSHLFTLAADVEDGGSKVAYSDLTGRALFNPLRVRLSNSSKVADVEVETVNEETGEVSRSTVRKVFLSPSYARLANEPRIAGGDFKARIDSLVSVY